MAAPQVEEIARRYYEVPEKDRGRIRWVLDWHDWLMMKGPDYRYVNDYEGPFHVLGRPVRFEAGASLRIELD